jgi:hypothetical protein
LIRQGGKRQFLFFEKSFLPLTHHQEPEVSGTNRVKRHGGKAMRVLQTKIVYLHSSFFLVIAKGFDSSLRLVLGHEVIPPVVCYGK